MTSVLRGWWTALDVGSDERCVWLFAEVNPKKVERSLAWASVERAEVFKRDLLTTDLICLVFFCGPELIEVNEEMPGWKALLRNAELHLPAMTPSSEWQGSVMKPAFEEKREVVYVAGSA